MSNARTAGPRMPPGYRYLRHLGAGGFGDVHLAEHVASGRLAAIKHIQPHLLSDPDTMARFVREARILASTDVPTVVRVYDLDTTGDPAYLAMEYVPGVTLWDLMEVAPLPPRQALPILRAVSEALRVMGLRGLVHRDIKPSNVFVLPSGQAKLGDFGLARPMEADGGFRTTGAPAGTPAYFPPEVSAGDAEATLESDAYSFAVMVFEVLAGVRPINAPDAISLITAHWTQPPTPVTSVMPDFPAGPAELLMRALAKQPAGRPLPHELMAALDAVPPGFWSTNARPDVQVPDTPPIDDAYEDVAGVVTFGADELGSRVAGSAPATVALLDGPAASSAPVTVTVLPSAPSRTVHVDTRTPPVRDGRGRGWWLGIGILAALAIVAGLAGWRLLGQDEEPSPSAEPIQVLTVTAVADPRSARCPRANVVVVASIGTNGRAGSVAVSWTLVDGTSGPRQVFSLSEGQREVDARLEITLSGSRSMSGQVGVMVEPTGLSTTAPVAYRCPQPPARYGRPVVETVTPDDEDALAAVSVLMRDFDEEYDEPSPEPEALAAILRTRIADGNATVLLGRDESGGPVGVAVLRLQPSLWSEAMEAYLAELYVVPARRGQGFGRALLSAVLDTSRDAGADYVFLITSEDDRLAQRAYEAAGFRRTRATAARSCGPTSRTLAARPLALPGCLKAFSELQPLAEDPHRTRLPDRRHP